MKKYFKFTINETVIDKSDYDNYLFKNTHFTNQIDNNLVDFCSKKYEKKDCSNDYYEESYKKYFPLKYTNR